MLRRNLKRVAGVALLSLPAAMLTVVMASPTAHSHGYSMSPISRSLHCAQGTVTNCGQIQYEPQSVEGPKGFPGGGPRDGLICAGGDERWAPLDNPRGGNWPATTVQPGQSFTFRWHLTAAHATTSFEYYITNGSYNPSEPLTRSDLNLQPFHTVSYGGEQPPFDVSHNATLPNRQGRHLILGVWTIADTGNAFYQCSDVVFGEDGGGEPPKECEAPAWDPASVYTGGDLVTHNGREWRAKWWTRGEEPGTTGQWGVWDDLGAC